MEKYFDFACFLNTVWSSAADLITKADRLLHSPYQIYYDIGRCEKYLTGNI